MVDVPSGQVVTNDFPQITHDLFFEWRDHHRPDAPDLWPDDVREEMEEVMERVFTDVNNGVYRCGFAGSQAAYEKAYDRLWAAIDWLEERLADRRYLMGDTITEADVRLYTTLARFDAVYHGHFKCNRQKLTELPNLWGYARDLFQTPGFGDNTDFEQIQEHYYVVQDDINPTGVVPKGPDPDVWLQPHGARLSATSGHPYQDSSRAVPGVRLHLERGVLDAELLAEGGGGGGQHRVGVAGGDEVGGGDVHAGRQRPQVEVVDRGHAGDGAQRRLDLGRVHARRGRAGRAP